MLTLHCAGGSEMMRAALAAQQKHNPQLLLLGVTVLTSMDSPGLQEIGVTVPSAEQVTRLGQLAATAGLRGLVCSPLEVALLRQQLPAAMQLITPGIRPAHEAGTDDQKRVMTPANAAQAGSSYIVVGRPILQAADPAAAARAILAELACA
jgi:orotidine-5'-phosphate decarboxylase